MGTSECVFGKTRRSTQTGGRCLRKILKSQDYGVGEGANVVGKKRVEDSAGAGGGAGVDEGTGATVCVRVGAAVGRGIGVGDDSGGSVCVGGGARVSVGFKLEVVVG